MLWQHYHGRHFTELSLTVRLVLSRLDQFRKAKIENFGIAFARGTIIRDVILITDTGKQ